MTRKHFTRCTACGVSLMLAATGCLETRETSVLERRRDPESALSATNPDPAAAADGARASDPALARGLLPPFPNPIQSDPSEVCTRGGWCRSLKPSELVGIDLLFVIDNSNSMAVEQSALREQFPRLIRTLTTGQRADGSHFVPARDVHLGVVSTDMGVVGVPSNFPLCNTQRSKDGGDDGLLLHRGGMPPACDSWYPPFLEYVDGRDAPEKIARDFGCIANLGTMGCGFEQPLEAALKALWPKHYTGADGTMYSPEMNPLVFVSATPAGKYGHGDTPPAAGNAGFARNDPEAMSLLAVIVVSDEDDCSARKTDLFRSTSDPMDPLSKQPVNLRCFHNQQDLFDIDRYTIGLRSLRPNHHETVMFGAIVGVPPDLVDATARGGVDFTNEAMRDAYYDRVLDDPRMQLRIEHPDEPSMANLAASCAGSDRRGQPSMAYPPRRIVEVAKGFGVNGTVQSICQDDFGPPIDGAIDMMAQGLGPPCLPQKLKRHDDIVSCDVLARLPPKSDASSSVLTDCSAPYLIDLDRKSAKGGALCRYVQVPVHDGQLAKGDGFYYDDFSASRSSQCGGGSGTRIAFTSGATPPAEMEVFVDCPLAPEAPGL